ncbi:MAG: adenylate/guanylate cyclase domain-containing protein [Candidatus Rifleibacteriota bacterium]
MNKNEQSKASTIFRKLFAVFYPIFVTLLLIALSAYLFNLLQTYKIRNSKNLWREKANLLLASIKSNHNFSHIVRTCGNNFVSDIEQNYPASLKKKEFTHIFARNFSPQIRKEIPFRWAFTLSKNKIEILNGEGFANTHRWVMKKLFKTLNDFSSNPGITDKAIRDGDKFIKNVLGPWSAPLTLGREREGTATPVQFSGEHYYFYWRKFKLNNKTAGGIILFFPEKLFANKKLAMQMITNKIFKQSKQRMAAAFVPCDEFKNLKPIIVPAIIDNNKSLRDKYLSLLARVKQLPSYTENKIQFIDNYVFIRGMYNLDSIYDAVIFAPIPEKFAPDLFPTKLIISSAIVFWLIFFLVIRLGYGKTYLPLKVSFRMFFFLSGSLPIIAMLITGFQLIEATHQSEILELKQKNIKKLSIIDGKSDSLLPLFSWHISRLLGQPAVQKELINNSTHNLNKIFRFLTDKLKQKKLNLSFMFAYEKDNQGKLYLNATFKKQSAQMMLDIMSASLKAFNKHLNRLQSYGKIMLTPSQENFYSSLKELGRNFLQELYANSIEHETLLALGENQKNYFYSSVVLNNGKINKYLTFSVDSEVMFRNYLRHQLNTINIDNSTIFLAAEQLKDSRFSVFPIKKMNFLNSKAGKNAFNFIKKCRGSIFPEYLSGNDQIYIYYPMTKMSRYAVGCAITLSNLNLNREKKRLVLIILAVLLICAIYILAYFASKHLIKPIEMIGYSLDRISKGKLDQKINMDRKDEIGLLANTLNIMQNGFKNRIKLGKFVSGTLDKTISSSNKTIEQPSQIKGTVLFSDIRSFTSLSENNPPEEIASMLNHHLDTMSGEIHKFNGQVEQFIGDALVAFFPDRSEPGDSKLTALEAAINIRKKHNKNQEQRNKISISGFEIGIGLKYGVITAGTLKSASRSEFLILGEAKAIAERLEAASKKALTSRIIVTNEYLHLINLGYKFSPLADEKNVYEVSKI